MVKMKSAEEWLALYEKSHQNPKNRLIHKISVPIIYWSTFAFIWAALSPQLSWVFLCLVLLFYMFLGLNYFMEMAIVSMLGIGGIMIVEAFGPNLFWTSAISFVAGWAAQIYGHKIEGKKPALFDNLFFMLIGPVWSLNTLLRRKMS